MSQDEGGGRSRTRPELIRWLEGFPLHEAFGLRVLRADEEESHLRLDRLELVQVEGAGLHGGVFFLTGASAGVAALRGRLAPHLLPVTLELSVTVVANTTLGAPLHLRGRVVHLGGTVGVAEVEIRARDERLLALARLTAFIKDVSGTSGALT